MALAAGLGLRMRPLTETMPKPLIEVGGRALLDWGLDHLVRAGVADVVVNLHHLAPQVEAHLADRKAPAIHFSHESELLETGGGIAGALDLLGPDPFYVTNSDVIWLDGPEPALGRLAERWDDGAMDGLLLLHSTVEAYGYDGRGDFFVDPLGLLTRRPERDVAPFLFTGAQILHPRLFAHAPEGAFSLNLLYDRALAGGRLFGVVHDGEWFHVGSPDGLARARTYMAERHPGNRHR
jgi:MurNAc alpha-1-phosphate uridylyltransferase